MERMKGKCERIWDRRASQSQVAERREWGRRDGHNAMEGGHVPEAYRERKSETRRQGSMITGR